MKCIASHSYSEHSSGSCEELNVFCMLKRNKHFRTLKQQVLMAIATANEEHQLTTNTTGVFPKIFLYKIKVSSILLVAIKLNSKP